MQYDGHDPVLIIYPTQTIYTCPLCQKDHAIYSSWTRHLSGDHPTHKVEMVFECSACGQQYPSKRSFATHFRKSHDDLSEPDRSQPTSGSWNCEFCTSKYPTKKSLGQHVRNNHASEASEKRDHAAFQSVSRYWSDSEHQLFLNALYHLGPSSNIAISKSIGTKSAKQVGIHKRIFLRDHPNWLENARREVALSPSCPDTNPLPSLSDHPQSLPDTSPSPSNLPPSPPTAPLSNGTGYPECPSSQTIHSKDTTPPPSPTSYPTPQLSLNNNGQQPALQTHSSILHQSEMQTPQRSLPSPEDPGYSPPPLPPPITNYRQPSSQEIERVNR